MAGRIRRFIKRNMSYPKGVGRRRTATRAKSAEYTRGERLQESQLDIANPLASITDGLTQAELLYGTGDLNTDAGAGNTRLRAAISGLHWTGGFTVEEGISENSHVAFYLWLMMCDNLVLSDWTLNGRHPYQGGLQAITTATPFKLLSPVVRREINVHQDNDFRGERPCIATLWHKRRFTVPMPQQVYVMYHMQIISDGTTAGIPVTTYRYTSRYGAKVYRPNLF